jgi:hypothetical protein
MPCLELFFSHTRAGSVNFSNAEADSVVLESYTNVHTCSGMGRGRGYRNRESLIRLTYLIGHVGRSQEPAVDT